MNITETVYAPTRQAWRKWLERHHAAKREIWLIFDKKGSGRARLEYGHAVEEALCFGWIDTTVKAIDEKSYAQRFTPRKPGSTWSTPNLERVKRLVADGLMTPAGAVHLPSKRASRVFRAEHAKRLAVTTVAPKDLAACLRGNSVAARQWQSLAPGYKRLFIRWIIDARLPATRARRVAATVAKLARGLKHPMAAAPATSR